VKQIDLISVASVESQSWYTHERFAGALHPHGVVPSSAYTVVNPSRIARESFLFLESFMNARESFARGLLRFVSRRKKGPRPILHLVDVARPLQREPLSGLMCREFLKHFGFSFGRLLVLTHVLLKSMVL